MGGGSPPPPPPPPAFSALDKDAPYVIPGPALEIHDDTLRLLFQGCVQRAVPLLCDIMGHYNISDVTNNTAGRSETTCEPLVLRVAAILSALLIITLTVIIMIVIIFTVVTVKLSRDKANLKQVIKALPLEQDIRSLKTEKELVTGSGDYEDIDAYKTSDMNINENAAYSTITNL